MRFGILLMTLIASSNGSAACHDDHNSEGSTTKSHSELSSGCHQESNSEKTPKVDFCLKFCCQALNGPSKLTTHRMWTAIAPHSFDQLETSIQTIPFLVFRPPIS